MSIQPNSHLADLPAEGLKVLRLFLSVKSAEDREKLTQIIEHFVSNLQPKK